MSKQEIKAIETKYKGYRFRSRLEARWAVFFDACKIRWEYEKEGYDLDGLRYLPDFWLPDFGMWIEVKPKLEPINTDNNYWWMVPDPSKPEEFAKAAGLTFATRSPVVVVCGPPGPEPQGAMFSSFLPPAHFFELLFAICPPDQMCASDEARKHEHPAGVIGYAIEHNEMSLWGWEKHQNRLMGVWKSPKGVLFWMSEIAFSKSDSGQINICTAPVMWPVRGSDNGILDFSREWTAARSARFEFGETPR